MKKICSLLTLFIASLTLYGQEDLGKISDSIVAEGVSLYKLEMASWYGTDIFIEKYDRKENIGGYFSYLENNIAKCVFFSRGDLPKVIGIISFDTSYNP